MKLTITRNDGWEMIDYGTVKIFHNIKYTKFTKYTNYTVITEDKVFKENNANQTAEEILLEVCNGKQRI